MEDFINKLKEEISKEPVWASLQVIEIIDELAEPQSKYKRWPAKTPIEVPTVNTNCVGVAVALLEDEPSNEKRTE